MKQRIHLDPIVMQMRAYDDPGFYPGPYETVGTVTIACRTATITGLRGTVHRSGYLELIQKLEALGVTCLQTERRGKVKVRALRKAAR
jgi:hypothetical protein